MLLPLVALKGGKTSRHLRAGQTLLLNLALKHGPTARTVSLLLRSFCAFLTF